MNSTRWIYLCLFLLSASILCFEIVSTRIASVIFVDNYAFMILSLAILGLGSGGVFSYYKIKTSDNPSNVLFRSFLLLGVSLCASIILVIQLSITNPFIYFILLFLPFFFGGIVYAQIYKNYSELSFKLYASDLSGAALGSLASLALFSMFGASNIVLLLALVMFGMSVRSLAQQTSARRKLYLYSILVVSFGALLYNGKNDFLGRVPIGDFPEKDFYHVYPDPTIRSEIIDSRWSIHGRSDLVRYSHQDMVRQLFIDGAAGTQVYRFNGDVRRTNSILQELLLHHTNSIPFLCLNGSEKRTMLVIGPGGGKEVLIGLFGEVQRIVGVEVNPDFVQIVKDQRDFDGGIYSDFSNVKIIVEEGRNYVKRSKETYDLIVMALPSTEQLQNIEPFATSENYLLTKEAIQDYLRILTPDGRLILTVHNRWELTRLITTTLSVFSDMGIAHDEMPNHFAVFEAEYAPTVVIKKAAFTMDETLRWRNTCQSLPRDFPQVTYLPYEMISSDQPTIGNFLREACRSEGSLQRSIRESKDDISPCRDDEPYFYKMDRGVPQEHLWLLGSIAGFSFLVVWLPFRFIRKKATSSDLRNVALPLFVFSSIGVGAMVLEISLFQKLVLYLGSPTISLSILLSSLLIGMGIGSYFGKRIYEAELRKRLYIVSLCIVVAGVLFAVVSPYVLSKCLGYSLGLRSSICFLMILPLAFLLGIPFPSCIQMLTRENKGKHVPWMYGVNGFMSVLGSVLAIVLSMLIGFTPTYLVGLAFYLGIFVLLVFTGVKKTQATV